MALLSRVAGRLYWAARYIERAEDTARVIRAYQDLAIDQSDPAVLRWDPLASIAGTAVPLGESADGGEDMVMELLIADLTNPGSISSSVAMARENLRTTREVMPREAWLTLNALSQHVEASAPAAVSRQFRDRFLAEVVGDSRQLDGVIESTMTRAHPYRMWRMGRLVERADMTTRVVGVRAAALLHAQIEPSVLSQAGDGGSQSFSLRGSVPLAGGLPPPGGLRDEVQWMGVLRSVSALQMYQRATRGPIEGAAVVRFLLFYSPFPRSVQGCLDDLRSVVMALPSPQEVVEQLDQAQTVLDNCDPIVSDGVALDLAMEDCQRSIAAVHSAILTRFVEW